MHFALTIEISDGKTIACVISRAAGSTRRATDFDVFVDRAKGEVLAFADSRYLDALHACNNASSDYVLLVRNEDAILDGNFLGRLERAAADLKAYDGRFSIASPLGLSLDRRPLIASFSSEEPSLITCAHAAPIVACGADCSLIDKSCLEAALRDFPDLNDAAIEIAIIAGGLKLGKIPLYLPALSIAVCGKYKAVDLAKLVTWVQTDLVRHFPGSTIATFMGDIEAPPSESRNRMSDQEIVARRDSFQATLEKLNSAMCRRLDISIVTRTTFARVHLLKRLLTSIERARNENTDVEIVLSTDIPAAKARKIYDELKKEFVNLKLVLQINNTPQASRVRNMVGGILAAKGEYVWIIDDDDYVDLFAFKHIRDRLFHDLQPLIFATCDLHNEKWDAETTDFPVLASSHKQHSWPSNGWRSMFNGVNEVPVCGAIMPRAFVTKCLKSFQMNFDFSEDYTLFLLLIGSRGLPPIVEISSPVAHISVRTTPDQTVTLTDRSGWTRDINGFVYDLMVSEQRLDFSLWGNLSTQPPAAHLVVNSGAVKDLTDALALSRRHIELLKQRLASVESEWLIQRREVEVPSAPSIAPQPVPTAPPPPSLKSRLKGRALRYGRAFARRFLQPNGQARISG